MKKSNFDVIFIPGGGLEKSGRPHPWVIRRLNRAAELYTGREYLVPLGRGTPHRPPPRDKKGFPIDESVACAKYLESRGVPKSHLLHDRLSTDTIGNAYFSRIFFSDPFGFKKILVVTSSHHLPRTKAIFNWIYGLTPKKRSYSLVFEEVSDEGFNPKVIQARVQKEKISLMRLLKDKKRIKGLAIFERWLFTKHAAYAYGLETWPISKNARKTY